MPAALKSAPPAPARSPRAGPLLVAGAVLAAGVAGHCARGPAPVDARDPADGLEIRRIVETIADDEDAREQLRRLRSRLGRHPLDARTRTTYAVLLLALATTPDAAAAAAFHASCAAAQAPVTVPVNRRAALVLASAGRPAQALDLVRAMFGYDAEAAARVLTTLRPLIPMAPEEGIPDDPDAYLAWVDELRRAGDPERAARALAQSVERWPEHLPTVRNRASTLVARQDWDALDALLERARIPADGGDAHLIAYRARLRAARGAPDDARRDVERAVAQLPQDVGVLMLAGDVYEALGEFDRAGKLFQRAAYRVPRSQPAAARAGPMVRLARLAERTGQGGEAVRRWREVLEIDPGHAEAARRIALLTAPSP